MSDTKPTTNPSTNKPTIDQTKKNGEPQTLSDKELDKVTGGIQWDGKIQGGKIT